MFPIASTSALVAALALLSSASPAGIADPAGTAGPSVIEGPAQRGRGKQSGPRVLVAHDGSIDGARKAAAERNVPVFLFVLLEGEEQNEEWQRSLTGSRELAGRSLEFVPVMANNGSHDREKIEVGTDEEGEPIFRELCVHYRTPTCKQHQEAMDTAWLEFPVDGALRCPQLITLLPNGELFKRIDTTNPIAIDEILRTLDLAIAKAGPGLSPQGLLDVRAATNRAEAAVKRKDHGAAWRSWQAALDITQAELYAQPARAGQTAALAAMAEQRAALDALVAEEKVLDAYKLALSYRTAWEGTPPLSELQKWIKKLERGKNTRDAIEAYRRELEAEEMYQEAMGYFAEGKNSKGERQLKLLLRKYADTKAGLRVADEYPHLVTK